MIDIAAITTCTILFGLAIFQFALILGAPIGRFAWGGAHTILPTKLRIGSVTSIILYAIFTLIILSKAGIITVFSNQAGLSVSMWVLAVYFCLGIPLNAISRSKSERNLMTPIITVLAALTVFIALN
jgi:hypothetical protein